MRRSINLPFIVVAAALFSVACPSTVLPVEGVPHWFMTRHVSGEGRGILSVELPLSSNRVSAPATGEMLLEIRITPVEGSGAGTPAAFALIGAGGKPLAAVNRYRRADRVGGVFKAKPGTHTVAFDARPGGEGVYCVQVHLSGDVDGDRDVDQDDVALFGAFTSGGAASLDAFYDINRDGRINEADLKGMEGNLGVASVTIPFLLTYTTAGLPGDGTLWLGIYGPVADTPTNVQSAFTNYAFDLKGTPHLLAGLKTLPMVQLPPPPTGKTTAEVTIPLPAEAINSGRFVFGAGQALSLSVNADGSVSMPDPSLANPSMYDFVEFTMNWPPPLPDNKNFINVNTTTVDQFCLPIRLNLLPPDLNNPNGVGITASMGREDIFTRYLAYFPSGTSPFSLGAVPDVSEKSAYCRLLAPHHVLVLKPTDPHGLLPGLEGFFDGAITASFTYMESEALTLAMKNTAQAASLATGRNAQAALSENWATAFIFPPGSIGDLTIGMSVSGSGLPGDAVLEKFLDSNDVVLGSAQTFSAVEQGPFTFSSPTPPVLRTHACMVPPPDSAFMHTAVATLEGTVKISDLQAGAWVTADPGAGMPPFMRVASFPGPAQVTLKSNEEIPLKSGVTLTFFWPAQKSGVKSPCTLHGVAPDYFVFRGQVLPAFTLSRTLPGCAIAVSTQYLYVAAVEGGGSIADLSPGMSVTGIGLPAGLKVQGTNPFPDATHVNLTAPTPIHLPVSSRKFLFSGGGTTIPLTCSITLTQTPASLVVYTVTVGSPGSCTGLYPGMTVTGGALPKGVTIHRILSDTQFELLSDQNVGGGTGVTLTCAWEDGKGPVSYRVLQFTGQNGSQQGLTYEIYYPYFSTNAQGTHPIPPPWLAGITEGAGRMVFACDGVFADNAGQFPRDALRSTILAFLENQVVSALNRGSLPRQVRRTGSIHDVKPGRGSTPTTATLTMANGDVSSLQVGMVLSYPGQGAQPVTIHDISPSGVVTLASPGTIVPVDGAEIACTVVMPTFRGSMAAGTPTGGVSVATVTLTSGDTSGLHPGMAVTGAGVTGGTTIQQITGPTSLTVGSPTPIRPVIDMPLTFSDAYPGGGTWNGYAWFWHQPGISIAGKAYGFPYDDNGGNSSDTATTFQGTGKDQVSMTIGPWGKGTTAD